MRCRSTIFFLIFTFLTFYPIPTFAADNKLTLTGSSTIAPLVNEIAKRFEQENETYRIDVQTGGSSRGIADALRGLADIGMSSRSLYEKEKLGIAEHLLAMDGVAFVVHAENKVNSVSKEQLAKVITGKINNWKELGGIDAPINVINRAKGRSEYDLITEYLEISPKEINADAIAGENQHCVKIVTGNTNAISYLSLGTAQYERQQGTKIKLLNLNGVEASVAKVKSREYPLVRPLVLVTKAKLDPGVQKFLAYALSSKVEDLVGKHTFVSINE